MKEAAMKEMNQGQEAFNQGKALETVTYQKTLTESVDGAQKVFRIVESNAQAVTRSAERLQASAEQAGKGIQETFSTVVSKLKETYSPS